MNIMNQMKHASGLGQVLKNIFVFRVCKTCFYVHKPTCGSFICICEAVGRCFEAVGVVFMNYMKIYEEGFINGFFGVGLFFCCGLMNIGKECASLMFINWPTLRPPLPFGHLPQIPLRGYLGEKVRMYG